MTEGGLLRSDNFFFYYERFIRSSVLLAVMNSKAWVTVTLILSLLVLLGCAEQTETLPDVPAEPQVTEPADTESAEETETLEKVEPQPIDTPNTDQITHADMSAMPKDISDYSVYESYYVSENGDDNNDGSKEYPFATISHALENVGERSVVYVREGLYKTHMLTIDKSDFVLAAYPGETAELQRAVVDDNWDMNDDLAFVIEGDVRNVVIDGLAINGFEEVIHYGDPSTQENLIFKNLIIQGAGDVAIGNAYPDHSEYLVDGLRIENVNIKDVSGIGIHCGDEQNRCARNVFVNKVVVEGAGAEDDTGYDSLAMVQSDNVVVMNSQFTNAPGDGLDFKATRVSVVNTVVANPNRNGMKFWNDGEMVNCLVSGTGADAAIVLDAARPGGLGFKMINSVVEKHSVGERSYAMTFNYDTQTDSPIVFRNNVIKEMTGPIYVNEGSSLSMYDNTLSDFDGVFIAYGDNEYSSSEELNAENWASGNVLS
jgi:hypothetical protein